MRSKLLKIDEKRKHLQKADGQSNLAKNKSKVCDVCMHLKYEVAAAEIKC